jgi:septal ring factor EnvC (AmiA/AmiB activator)
MVGHIKYLVLVTIFIIEIFPQSEDIQQKKSELSEIKTEINKLEQELAAKSAKQKKSFEAVENLNKQNYLINKILGELRKDIIAKEKQITIVEKNIGRTESEIRLLQENYAKYVVAIYKKGKFNELESLFESASLQQAIMRTYYLQVFAEQRERDLVELKNKKEELVQSEVLLQKERNEKLALAKSRDDERKNLIQKLNEKKATLKSIEKNKKELKKLIAAKKESQEKIEGLIVKLVEEENQRKKQLLASAGNSGSGSKIRDENVSYEYDLSTTSFSSFAEMKGKMNWPLHRGRIIRRFGENRNKSLNTVTLNYGVDIKADKDKNIYSVGEGVVAAIDWLPGYGNVIIISHRDEYRTVYGHVSEIFVSEGDKIKTGMVLALVDEGIDGYVLHFEIWKGRDKQNPEQWLGRK